jgi:acyl-CoA synthetase (AMP-forming)/AMP-acid ligase II/acyl carrier protein
MNLTALLTRNAATSSEQRAAIFLDDHGGEAASISWSELRDQVAGLSLKMKRRIPPGQTVILVFDSGIAFGIAFLACQAAGLIAVPLPPMETNRAKAQVAQIRQILMDTEAAHLLTAGRSETLLRAYLSDENAPAIWSLNQASGNEGALPEGDADAVGALLYTSGSTSAPKGVTIRQRHLAFQAEHCSTVWGVSRASRLVSWMPNQHSFGLIYNWLVPLFSGCSLVFMAPGSFIAAPHLWFTTAARYRTTHGAAATFGYQAAVERVDPDALSGLDLSAWRSGLVSAEPVTRGVCESFLDRFGALGLPKDFFIPLYGLSETGVITSNPPARAVHYHHKPETPPALDLACVGPPLPRCQARIVAPQSGESLPEGAVGEVWVAGPCLMDGYWRRPKVNAEVMVRDGETVWFRTGDQGFLQNGRLTITGRLKEIAIVRGKNIYPLDIEWAAKAADDAVTTAAAFADSEGLHASLVLLVELAEGSGGDSNAMLKTIRDEVFGCLGLRLDHLFVVPAGSILKTASGKIRRGPSRQALLRGTIKPLRTLGAQDADEPDLPLADWIKHRFAELIQVPLTDVDEDAPLADYHLDSVALVQLAREVEQKMGRKFHPFNFFRSETLRDLIELATGSD